MSIALVPYLNFMGKTGEAVTFYKDIFGGELNMSTYEESNVPCSDEDKDKIMHAELKTEFFTLMASDGNKDHPVQMGDSVNLSLNGNDEEKLTEYFNKLAEGGKIDMPLAKQFWGDTFGMCTDKFGMHWMVNISKK